MRRMLLALSLLSVNASPAFADASGFAAWKQQFAGQARQQGISPQVIGQFMQDAQFLPKVIELDRKQPEKKKTFAEYYESAVSQTRIENGRNAIRANFNALNSAERRFGVPKEVIVALWGMETSYGSYTGDWGVYSTLATLAYEGRRASFFRGELMSALKIVQSGEVPASKMRGSWAGAMGQSQFMPSSYLRYAVDGDGDGKRDIWSSRADVFASAANYLRTEGWKPGMTWGTRVSLYNQHQVAPALVGLEENQGRTLSAWHNLGLREDNDKPFNVAQSEKLWLVAPDGLSGPKYLVTRNYKTIMHWNKSTYFATSVGRLSDQIAQGTPPTIRMNSYSKTNP